jgi:hypothetical protein
MRTFTALLLVALLSAPAYAAHRGAWTGEPTTISTRGFSITFPAKWHVETDDLGAVFAGINGEMPPFIILYFVDEPNSANPEEWARFEREKNRSIADVMGEKGAKMIVESDWHLSETIQHLNGIREERLDFEGTAMDKESGRPQKLCGFVRFFHNAPHAEVYLAFTAPGPCEQAWAEFEDLIDSIVWK